jgi:hypothetical protein
VTGAQDQSQIKSQRIRISPAPTRRPRTLTVWPARLCVLGLPERWCAASLLNPGRHEPRHLVEPGSQVGPASLTDESGGGSGCLLARANQFACIGRCPYREHVRFAAIGD